MKSHVAFGALLLALTVSSARADDKRHDASAAAYEHLATAIIEIRATEDRLVEGILNHHFALAVQHLQAAKTAGVVGDHAKAAADEITALANEGNKQVQAVRQRLLKAGHHHHTDAETEDDYIWIDGGEKKAFLDLAGKVARMRDGGDAATIDLRIRELTELFKSAMQPE